MAVSLTELTPLKDDGGLDPSSLMITHNCCKSGSRSLASVGSCRDSALNLMQANTYNIDEINSKQLSKNIYKLLKLINRGLILVVQLSLMKLGFRAISCGEEDGFRFHEFWNILCLFDLRPQTAIALVIV